MSETKIALDSDVTGVVLTRENEWTENVNGVKYGNTKVWGRPYTFKWDWDPYLNTTSSTLTVPSKYFLYKPDDIITWHNESSSFNTNAYMPHDDAELPRGTNSTVYYGDRLYYTQASLTSSVVDPCIGDIFYYSANSYDNVKSNVTVNAMPVVKSQVSFLTRSFPDSLYGYFSNAVVTYTPYSSTSTKSYIVTSGTNNPIYIASNSVDGNIAECTWNFLSNDSGEWVGCKKDDNYYPLWTALYTHLGFPTQDYICWSIPTPTNYQLKWISHIISSGLPSSYMYFNTIYSPTYSWSYKLGLTATVNLNATINWRNVPVVSSYAYYKIVIFGYQLHGSTSAYQYVPSTADNVFRYESSTIYHSSIASKTSYQALSISHDLRPDTTKDDVYIIWRAGLIGSNTNSSDTSTWDWLDIYSNIRHDTINNTINN